MDVVAADVVQALRFTDLRGGLNHNPFDCWIVERIHDAAQVLGASGTPEARFSGIDLGEPPKFIGPLRDC